MYIYKITNKINKKVYIGQTIQNLKKRWNAHKAPSSECICLSRAIQKYGKENFQIEVIEECLTTEELNQREVDLIKSFNSLAPNGYNLTQGGEGIKGFTHSPETKRKMSEAKKGKKFTEEHKDNLKNSHRGKTLSTEHRENIGKSLKGRICSQKTRKKIGDANKGEKSPNWGKPASNRRAIEGFKEGSASIIFKSIKEATFEEFSPTCIHRCLKGERKTHKGRSWRYAE